jgi:hypothetical protein
MKLSLKSNIHFSTINNDSSHNSFMKKNIQYSILFLLLFFVGLCNKLFAQTTSTFRTVGYYCGTSIPVDSFEIEKLTLFIFVSPLAREWRVAFRAYAFSCPYSLLHISYILFYSIITFLLCPPQRI